MGEGIWNSHSLWFRGCEDMVDRGELLGDYGVSPLLPREQPLLPLVLRDLVLGLQLGKGLHHPVDKGLILSLRHSVGLLSLQD